MNKLTFKEKLDIFLNKEPKPLEILSFVVVAVSMTLCSLMVVSWLASTYGSWVLLLFPAISASYLLYRILKV